MQFVPFEETMLDAGSKLLCENYRALRRAGLALLPQRFEELDAAREALKSLLDQPKVMSLAAYIDGAMRAYLIHKSSALIVWFSRSKEKAKNHIMRLE